MSVYTRTGDKGSTRTVGGAKLSKASIEIEAYGSVDETNSALGFASIVLKKRDKSIIENIQQNLYLIMSALAGGPNEHKKIDKGVAGMEAYIDIQEKKLPKLSNFIIPGQTEEAVRLHMARTVCRRAERVVTRLQNNYKSKESLLHCLRYLNRLSDMLFIMARVYGNDSKVFRK